MKKFIVFVLLTYSIRSTSLSHPLLVDSIAKLGQENNSLSRTPNRIRRAKMRVLYKNGPILHYYKLFESLWGRQLAPGLLRSRCRKWRRCVSQTSRESWIKHTGSPAAKHGPQHAERYYVAIRLSLGYSESHELSTPTFSPPQSTLNNPYVSLNSMYNVHKISQVKHWFFWSELVDVCRGSVKEKCSNISQRIKLEC
jgi:hypothetical protein